MSLNATCLCGHTHTRLTVNTAALVVTRNNFRNYRELHVLDCMREDSSGIPYMDDFHLLYGRPMLHYTSTVHRLNYRGYVLLVCEHDLTMNALLENGPGVSDLRC